MTEERLTVEQYQRLRRWLKGVISQRTYGEDDTKPIDRLLDANVLDLDATMVRVEEWESARSSRVAKKLPVIGEKETE